MSKFFDVEEVEFDLLGAKNPLRSLLEGYVSSLAEGGKGFTFGRKVDARQEDVLKLTDSAGVVLGEKIKMYYPEATAYLAAAKYFLRDFLCYVEVPTFHTERETGLKKASYTKFLATSNLEVANFWVEGNLVETVSKYERSVIYFDDVADDDYEVPILKLGSNKQGRSITRPRSYLDLDKKGTRVIPVFALKSYVDTLYSRINSEVAKVIFMKDNGTLRELDTCLSEDLLVDLYKDSSFVSGMLEYAYDGDFLGSKVIDRGYIRVPEVGSSIYDGSGIRAISYTRIAEIQYGVEPDMEFARVDLDGVVFAFSTKLSKLSLEDVGRVANALVASGFDLSSMIDSEGNHKFQIDSYQLENWADLMNRVLSTTFQRNLYLFMVTNPQWFGGYTGERVSLASEVSLGDLNSASILDDLDDLE